MSSASPAGPPGSASLHPAVRLYAEHINPAFVKLLGTFGYGRVFVRAQGMYLYDHEGREYLDCLAGFGAVNLGHSPPALVAAVKEALDAAPVNLLHIGPQPAASELADALARRAAPLTMSLFSSSGGEAVESAMKLARAATRKSAILYCEGGFHGTGFGSLSVMGHERLRKPFEPLVPGCHAVPFGDLEALERALRSHHPAAFLVEPIQGEGGVVLSPPGYLKAAQALCQKHGALFILDEIQTGLARTGALFAYELESVTPDILCLGKSLGGSLFPISATLTRPDLQRRAYGTMERFDLHGSTFSGNALACAAALTTLRLLDEERLAERAAERGDRLLTGLRAALTGHPIVREVRGSGLLIGIELGPSPTADGWLNQVLPGLVRTVARGVFGQWLALCLLERGIICQPASQRWEVLKLTPPLIISEAEVDRIIHELATLLDEYRDLPSIVKDAGRRLGRQVLRDFQF